MKGQQKKRKHFTSVTNRLTAFCSICRQDARAAFSELLSENSLNVKMLFSVINSPIAPLQHSGPSGGACHFFFSQFFSLKYCWAKIFFLYFSPWYTQTLQPSFDYVDLRLCVFWCSGSLNFLEWHNRSSPDKYPWYPTALHEWTN